MRVEVVVKSGRKTTRRIIEREIGRNEWKPVPTPAVETPAPAPVTAAETSRPTPRPAVLPRFPSRGLDKGFRRQRHSTVYN